MLEKTVESLIKDALFEADIMESARDIYDVEHMLLTAMRLSNAPYSFVRLVYERNAAFA